MGPVITVLPRDRYQVDGYLADPSLTTSSPYKIKILEIFQVYKGQTNLRSGNETPGIVWLT